MATKKRRAVENYNENYWETTLENTDIHNPKKFRGKLELVRDFIDANRMELNRIDRAGLELSGHNKWKANTTCDCEKCRSWVKLYQGDLKNNSVQNQIVRKFPTTSQVGKPLEIDYKVSARKAINGFVKLGFIEPGLVDYHSDVEKFLDAKTKRRRQSIFSKIIYENSNFRSSSAVSKPKGHLEFLLGTLEEVGKLCEDDRIGLMLTDIKKYRKGCLTKSELAERKRFSEKPNPVNGNVFKKDKYNQIRFLRSVLRRLDDLVFHNDCLYFLEDVPVGYHRSETKRRDANSQRLWRNNLHAELAEALGDEMCMVECVAYRGMIGSHIKAYIKCAEKEQFDINNGLCLGKDLDHQFDRGGVSFDDNGQIMFGKGIHPTLEAKWKGWKIHPAFLNPKRKEYLEWHRDNTFES